MVELNDALAAHRLGYMVLKSAHGKLLWIEVSEVMGGIVPVHEGVLNFS